MRNWFYGLTLIIFAIGFVGCATTDSGTSTPTTASRDGIVTGTYYTKVCFWVDKGKSYGTNYSKGMPIKAGTKVQITGSDSNEIFFNIPEFGDMKVSMENVEKYTQENIHGIFARTFSTTPVKISSSHAEAIRNGKVVVGMTRNEVIMARGYPPKHETPVLSMDEWHYWKHRVGRMFVYFKNDHVVSIKD